MGGEYPLSVPTSTFSGSQVSQVGGFSKEFSRRGGHRGGPRPTLLHFHHFCSPQTQCKIPDDPHPFASQHLHRDPKIQAHRHNDSLETNSRKGLEGRDRPSQCVLACTSPPKVPKVSGLLLSKETLFLQSAPLWPPTSSLHLFPHYELPCTDPSEKRGKCARLFGRPHILGSYQIGGQGGHLLEISWNFILSPGFFFQQKSPGNLKFFGIHC